MSIPELPALNPARFRWHASPTSPQTIQRLANGTEAWVGIKTENAKGQYDNYLNTTLRVKKSTSFISLESLKARLAAALVHVRFQHPEVACSAVWGETGPPYIQYTPPEDNVAALKWASGVIDVRLTSKSGLELRTEMVKRRRDELPSSAKSMTMFLIADVADEMTSLGENAVVDMLMHFNHIYWDGISVRAFAGDLLRCFGRWWNSTHHRIPDYKWGDEILNLSEPILDACKVDIETLDDRFYKAREEFVASLMKVGSSWGLPVINSVGTPCTEWYNFTERQSKAMIQAVKSQLGPQYTITHLGHAAMVLALLKANPMHDDTPDNTALITALPVNGRRFLREEYVTKQYGACQAPAVVEFENIKSWAVDDNDREAVKAALETGCKHIKKWYDYWLSKEFVLALGVSKDNFLSDFLSSNPMTFSASSTPVFISDGIVDQYVPGHVTDLEDQSLLGIDNCVFFLDTYLPDILIRMDSWDGRTALSICFNDGYYKARDAAKFLKYIANFMLAFTS